MLLIGFPRFLNIKKDAIEDAPNFGAEADVDFILGIAKVSDSVKIMLDIERVLSSSISQVSQLVEKSKSSIIKWALWSLNRFFIEKKYFF